MPEDEEDYSTDDVIEAHGFDPRYTPLDRLMAGSDMMHREVADHMENHF